MKKAIMGKIYGIVRGNRMSFEEILKAEFGEERVTIDYSKQSIDNTIEIIVLSEDRKREFKAQVILFMNNDIEMDGRRYNVYDLILALNTSFDKKK